MTALFFLQLITSFIIGGLAMAFLSIIAERASTKTAGIIISFPTTIAIGFFFVGWASSPEKVAEAAVVIPFMEGIVVLFAATYLYISKIKTSKLSSITLSVIGSVSAWFLATILLIKSNLNSLTISMLGYLVLTTFAYYLITIKPHSKTTKTALTYTTNQKIFRALFAGAIISLAVYLSKTLGTIWGVVFSAFPAVFISTMTIIHWHYDSSYLFKVFKNCPLGSLVFVVYALSAIYTFPNLGLIFGTLTSYTISALFMVILMKSKISNIKA